jgi:hypothetical protein
VSPAFDPARTRPTRPWSLAALAPWDLQCALRSATLTGALTVLSLLVTAATDEGGLTWSERTARVFPLMPVCVALATVLALAGPSGRGEGRALQALGRSPFGTACGAAVGAALVGLFASLVVLLDARISVHTFFPVIRALGPYTFDGHAFTNLSAGWRVTPDGTLSLPPLSAATSLGGSAFAGGDGLPAHARFCAAVVMALGSVAFALTIALFPPARRGRALLVLFVTAAATVFCLQAAASGRLPVLMAPVPSTALLLSAAWAIVHPEWQRATR